MPILGICGGMQMLGNSIADPGGIEGGGSADGLRLLPISTTLARTQGNDARSAESSPRRSSSERSWPASEFCRVRGSRRHARRYPKRRSSRGSGAILTAPAFADGSGQPRAGTRRRHLRPRNPRRRPLPWCPARRVASARRSCILPASAMRILRLARARRWSGSPPHVRSYLDIDAVLRIAGYSGTPLRHRRRQPVRTAPHSRQPARST